MERIVDEHLKTSNKNDLDNLYYELNKELRKRLRKTPRDYKVDLYVVGGACIVSSLQSRDITCYEVDVI